MLSFSHMIPHAMERWSSVSEVNDFGRNLHAFNPLQAVCMHLMFGYIITLFVDKVLFSAFDFGCDCKNSTEGDGSPTDAVLKDKEKCLSTRTAVLLLLAMSVHRCANDIF
jgi:hypothetical protein